ncbi:MAG: RNase adapter RapZ [Clostridiales bacterium]|jgi:UPF0042 nucleotide-binding protein|nr:RNase adapter RapZ [Clostridiales bacterium]
MYLLIVTGLSGAGKSCALAALADGGFYCVDNLPAALLNDLVKICSVRTPAIERVAVVIDARESLLASSSDEFFPIFDSLPCRYEILYLDSKNEIIERRYNETRRRHPLSEHIDSGIAAEREFLMPLRECANYIIDTSNLKPNDLKHELSGLEGIKALIPFSLVFQSFGYKNGVPLETDITYDMRFLTNPYYEPNIRNLSGLDKEIIDFLMKDDYIAEFLDSIEKNLRNLIPKYIEQGKHRLMISFGCTGGRHRSVFAANTMYQRLHSDYPCTLVHRDLKKWLPNYSI